MGEIRMLMPTRAPVANIGSVEAHSIAAGSVVELLPGGVIAEGARDTLATRRVTVVQNGILVVDRGYFRDTTVSPVQVVLVAPGARRRRQGAAGGLRGLGHRASAQFRRAFRTMTAPPTADDEVLTNSAVLGMIEAGLAEDTIIDKIKFSDSDFALSSSDLAHLKAAGVSDRIISAMLENQARRGGPRK